MIKVLHIIQGYGGGVSSIVKNLIVHSNSELIRQDVMSFSFEHAEEFLKDISKHGSKSFLMPRPRVEGYGKFKNYVTRVLNNEKYDVIHCHTDGWRAIIYHQIAKKCNAPIFAIHAHRTSNDPGRLNNNKLYIRFNQKISRKLADIKFACGRDAGRFVFGTNQEIVIITNGLDTDKCEKAWNIDRNKKRLELGCNQNNIFLLNVGRLVTQKNQKFLIDIAKNLKAQGVSFKLYIVGTGDLENELRKMINECSLDDCVILTGRRNDVYEIMAAADLMLLPSLYEGLPTVIIEAQAMGLKSIVSDFVTDECDLGLKLVDFEVIDDPEIWCNLIKNYHKHENTFEEVLDALKGRLYTADSSFNNYFLTLEHRLEEKK